MKTKSIPFIAALILLTIVTRGFAAPHTFTLDTSTWAEQPQTVSVAGAFNGWSATTTPMSRTGDAVYAATIDLPPGVALYKFVIDGQRWVSDPEHSDKQHEQPDGHGGINSAVLIAPPENTPAPGSTPHAAAEVGSATEAAGAPAPETPALHRFTLDTSTWDKQPQTLVVAGAFNGWSKTATPMRQTANHQWIADVRLDDGIQFYKFVADGERWLNDPRNSDKTLEAPDGNGGVNSAVFIGFDARKLPDPRPDHINTKAVSHDPDDFAQRSVVSDNTLMLGLQTQDGDIEDVWVHVRAGNLVLVKALSDHSGEMGLESFASLVSLETESPQAVYWFELRDGTATAFLTRGGVSATADHAESAAWPVSLEVTFTTPDWAKDATWYQIFPERFRNGNPANDPGDAHYENLLPWTADWWTTHTAHGETPGSDNFYFGDGNVWQRRFGGDLQGIREKLPYLRKLGINAIYLNPIFEADSMHKYDTADFRHVDDNLGIKAEDRFAQVRGETDDPATWGWSASDKVFLDFLEEAHAHGFKVVIDGVFNHVGVSHPFFQDVLEKGRESRYADWFEITDFGDPENYGVPETVGEPGGIQYKAWDGPNGHLPVFKKHPDTGLAPGPYQHIFNITRRWMDPNGDGDPSDGVDGWRLDVPGDIDHTFWIAWRKLVKGINPDAYITGEIWPWAQPWLQGDQFDAVMNYQFAMPAQSFFVDDQSALKPSEFAQRMTRLAYAYPMQVTLAQMNLFDSHDTDRLASMFVNPDRGGYDQRNRPHDTGPDYDPRKPNETEWQRLRQAAAFQATFPGAPMLYYGTEAGMWGPDDPSNRMPMVWEDLEPYKGEGVEFDEALFAYFQRLMAIRHSLPALRQGAFGVLLADDSRGTLAYERTLGDARVLVVLNRSDDTHDVKLPVMDEPVEPGEPEPGAGRWVDVLDEASADVVFDTSDPDARPTLDIRADAPRLDPVRGELSVKLGPYESAVLVFVSE